MNRADKIAVGFVTTITSAFIIGTCYVINEQSKEISRLKKRNRMLHEALKLSGKLNMGINVKDEIIDFVTRNTEIPNDISGFFKE